MSIWNRGLKNENNNKTKHKSNNNKKKDNKKDKKNACIKITKEDAVIYQGKVEEIPILESVIINKSIEFFDDATPCYIHKSAVRLRLVAEIKAALAKNDFALLEAYTGFADGYNVKALNE